MPRLYAALTLAFLLSACTPPAAKDPAPLQAGDTVQRGYVLIHEGQPEAAVNIFDRLIAHAPQDASAYNGKAVAFDHAGNHRAAQDIYQQALALSPDSLSIRNNLAMSLILDGQIDEAIPMLEVLHTQHPDNKTVRQNLALAYGLTGQRKEALQLNLEDVPPEQAKENMRFYKAYASRLKKLNPSDIASRQIGFPETPPAEAAAFDKNQKNETPAVPSQVPAPVTDQPAAQDSPAPSFPTGHRSIAY